MTTNAYIKGVKTKNWKPFNKRLWQRNYYEHIIRNEKAYIEMFGYIVNNPLKWHLDELNPQNLNKKTGNKNGSKTTTKTKSRSSLLKAYSSYGCKRTY
jgi:hypothetical protein